MEIGPTDIFFFRLVHYFEGKISIHVYTFTFNTLSRSQVLHKFEPRTEAEYKNIFIISIFK